jgi:hypothetical protein
MICCFNPIQCSCRHELQKSCLDNWWFRFGFCFEEWPIGLLSINCFLRNARTTQIDTVKNLVIASANVNLLVRGC